MILWSFAVFAGLLTIWLLIAALAVGLGVAQVLRQQAAQRLATARAEVRAILVALAQGTRMASTPDLGWWLAHAEALRLELTPALAENPSVRGALEQVAAAATPDVVRLLLGAGAAPASTADRTRLRQAAILVTTAPPRSARRVLLALQAGDDAELGVLASAALARRAAIFADVSSPIACFVGLGPEPARAIAGRWALHRILEDDGRRAAVHLHDTTPAVQSVALATVDRRALADRDEELVAYALSRTTDADAHVRAAAFTALSRVSQTLPLAPIQLGLADADAIVRMAAAQTLPLVEGNRLNLIAALDRADPGAGRTARRALRAQANGTAARPESGSTAQARIAWFRSVSIVPTADAEDVAVHALEDPDVSVRREAALALAAIARAGGLRLHRPTVDALLTRLEAEGAGPVSAAIVEALEASDDERAPTALSTLAARAKPTWRLRLTEAAALARRARAAAERRGRHRSSGRVPRPAR